MLLVIGNYPADLPCSMPPDRIHNSTTWLTAPPSIGINPRLPALCCLDTHSRLALPGCCPCKGLWFLPAMMPKVSIMGEKPKLKMLCLNIARQPLDGKASIHITGWGGEASLVPFFSCILYPYALQQKWGMCLSYTLAGTHIPIALQQQKPVKLVGLPILMVYPQWGMPMAGCIKKLPGMIPRQFLKL